MPERIEPAGRPGPSFKGGEVAKATWNSHTVGIVKKGTGTIAKTSRATTSPILLAASSLKFPLQSKGTQLKGPTDELKNWVQDQKGAKLDKFTEQIRLKL